MGYGSHMYWTWNSQSRVYNWAKWFPHTSAGNWEVYVYIASKYFGSYSARYAIFHGGSRDDRVLDQNPYSNQWVSLGSYYFAGGGNEYVYLTDATGEAFGTRYVGFDAVKFVRRDGPGPGPQPTPVPSGCTITPVLGFGRVWSTYNNVRTRLACPTEPEKGIWAGEEAFQGGYMFWRQDDTFLYVLYNNGTWQGYDDTWTTAEPEWDLHRTTGRPLPPKRGFGKVWRNNTGVRNGLGWATMEERGFYGSLQPFQGWPDALEQRPRLLVLYNDGRWERYN